MAKIRLPRGTQAALDALAGSSSLLEGEAYWLTDTDRIAVALTTSTYAMFYRTTELGTGATKNISVGTSAPGSPATGDLWVDTN